MSRADAVSLVSRWLLALAGAGLLGIGAAVAQPGPDAAPCRVPDIFLKLDHGLDRTESRIDRAAPVRLLLVGPHLDDPAPGDASRPALEAELRRRLPGVALEVFEDGQAGGLARDNFDHIRAAVKRLAPDLVIWEVGVGDALAATDPQDFARTLEKAAEWLDRRGVDLVLIDPPFVPNVRHEQLYGRIVNEILADRDRTNVVHLYGATTYLFSSPSSAARGHSGRACLPVLVAEAIARVLKRPPARDLRPAGPAR